MIIGTRHYESQGRSRSVVDVEALSTVFGDCKILQ